MHANQTLMVLISRFLPGLRIAIPVACAYAGVPPLTFSALNLISGFAWAGAIMLVIVRVGPGALSAVRPERLVGPAGPRRAGVPVLPLAQPAEATLVS